MKHVRNVINVLLLLLVAVFPYVPLSALWIYPGRMYIFWPAGLAAAALLLTRKDWSAQRLARAGMLVKLAQIPAYVLWFMIGAAMFLFMGFLLAFLIDAMTIALSGLVSLPAVLRCRKEGVLTRKQAVKYGILQFVFCIDIFSAVRLFHQSRKQKESFL